MYIYISTSDQCMPDVFTTRTCSDLQFRMWLKSAHAEAKAFAQAYYDKGLADWPTG